MPTAGTSSRPLAAPTGWPRWPRRRAPTTVVADVTVDADVARLAAEVADGGPLDALVNNAGGAFGLDPVESADLDHWRQMFELNVLGTLRVTQALLPQLREGDGGDIVVVTSTAAHGTYEGGAGYVGAKHAERMLATTLRWEIRRRADPHHRDRARGGGHGGVLDGPVRRGPERAAAVYAGYEPLVADDIADAIAWSLSRPAHVNIDLLVVRPRAQASNNRIVRTDP